MLKRILLAAATVALLATPAFAQTPAATTNSSVVIVTGNTFQTVLAAVVGLSQRRSLTIQNNNAADNCWITFGKGITAGNATTAKSILLASGQGYSRFFPYIPSDEIEGTCDNSNDTIYVDVQ